MFANVSDTCELMSTTAVKSTANPLDSGTCTALRSAPETRSSHPPAGRTGAVITAECVAAFQVTLLAYNCRLVSGSVDTNVYWNGASTLDASPASLPSAPVHMSWSNCTETCVSGSGTMPWLSMLVATTEGALIGAIWSMCEVSAISSEPSARVSNACPRVPPVASCRMLREASDTIHTLEVCGVVAPATASAATGRCAVLVDANISPASAVPAWPKAMLCTSPARRYSSCAAPLLCPVIGKLTISVVAFANAVFTFVPVKRTPHRRPSGPNARSVTCRFEKCDHWCVASPFGSKISMPLPELT